MTMSENKEVDHPLIVDEESGFQGQKVAFSDNVESLGANGVKQSGEDHEFGEQTKAEVRDHVQAVIDENEDLQKPTIVRNLSIAYVVSVGLVILLSIAGQVAVQIYINNSFSDSQVVNVAGRQRMLSQLIAKDSVAIAYFTEHGQNTSSYVSEMTVRLALFVQSQNALLNGDSSLGVPKTYDSGILPNFKLLADYYANLVSAASAALALNPSNMTVNSTTYQQFLVQMNIILANEKLFLPIMNTITNQFDSLGSSHLHFVLDLSWVLHSLVIVTLLLEGVFLFRPVLQKMQELINERFGLMKRTLVAEAESSGVSLLMMGYIANELKTPLKAISDYLASVVRTISTHAEREVKHDFVLDGMRADCQTAIEYIQDTNICISLMDTIVSDLSNMQSMQMDAIHVSTDVVDVVHTLRQVVRLVEKKVHEGVILEVSVATSIQENPSRQMDRQRLLQILINLVNHAIAVTREGTITLDVKEVEDDEKLRIEVVDQGATLDSDEQEDIFQPVMGSPGTSRRGNEGQGLCLYVVRMLVELLGGSVGTENVPAGGNMFWVELPTVKLSVPKLA